MNLSEINLSWPYSQQKIVYLPTTFVEDLETTMTLTTVQEVI
jgi:hypothetical protein